MRPQNLKPQNLKPQNLKPQNLKPQSKLIRSVLQPALRLWLRSQTQSLASLQVEIEGGDRQLISGQIPALRVFASQVVYQGLHLSQLRLVGCNIRMNLGQVVRGKPLRLLEPIRVNAELLLRPEDLNASLTAALFASSLEAGLTQLALGLRQTGPAEPSASVQAPQIQCLGQTLQVRAQWCEPGRPPQVLAIAAELTLDHNRLRCTQLDWLEPPPNSFCTDLRDLPLPYFDLGDDVELELLVMGAEGLICQGIITIHP